MTEPTPGSDFSPNRLTVARCLRKRTKKDLAEQVGVSAQAITAYEGRTKGSKPSNDTLTRIAFALGFPLSFLMGTEIDLVDAEEVTFRSRRTLRMLQRGKACAAGAIAAEIISPDLRIRFRTPELDLPDLRAKSRIEQGWPEQAARILRKHWSLGGGPIHNMVHLLESKGVEIYWLNEPDSCLDALSLWRRDKPFVILNSHKQAGDRARFDAAHELGHLVLHRRDNSLDGRMVETEADQFASAFLLPAETFNVESPRLPILNQYLPLKQRWGTSAIAMIRRGHDLKRFSDWHYEQAIKQLSESGWRTQEPVQLQREESLLHKLVFDRLATKGITPAMYSATLNIPLKDFLELLPAGRDFVSIDEMQLREKPVPFITQNDLILKLFE